MKLTPKIEEAIRRASELHDGQRRKADIALPYVTHLFSVAALLSTYAPNGEDIIVAGLLHDTLEDTHYTASELEHEFGAHIREIVESVTELTLAEKEHGHISWKDRKDRYLKNLQTAPAEALMVAAADKIHNLQTIINDFKKYGPAIWKNFSAPLENQLWFFGAVLAVLEERLESPIVGHLKDVYSEAKSILTAS